MPVTDSSFDLSCHIVQEGVIRRSKEAFSEITSSGISAMLHQLMRLLSSPVEKTWREG